MQIPYTKSERPSPSFIKQVLDSRRDAWHGIVFNDDYTFVLSAGFRKNTYVAKMLNSHPIDDFMVISTYISATNKTIMAYINIKLLPLCCAKHSGTKVLLAAPKNQAIHPKLALLS